MFNKNIKLKKSPQTFQCGGLWLMFFYDAKSPRCGNKITTITKIITTKLETVKFINLNPSKFLLLFMLIK